MNSTRNLKYFFNLVPVALVVFGNLTGGIYSFGNLFFTFIVLGVLELITGSNKNNDDVSEDILPDILMGLTVIGQTIAVSSLLYGVYSGTLSGFWIIGAVFSTGTCSGTLGIVVAHELIHRKNKIWNFLGRYLLFTAVNPYFYVAHLRIHHKNVGTDKDAATATFGESYYHFLGRSVYHQISKSFVLEKAKCEKNGFFVYGFRNHVMACFYGYITMIAILAFWGSFLLPVAFIGQGLVAWTLLAYTDYIEHYGLQRNEKERVNETHSWQSDKIISRYYLIDLSRHADHHYMASKPFHQLNSFDKSPVLPGGYATMFLPALIPPLWFSIMNKRAKALQ